MTLVVTERAAGSVRRVAALAMVWNLSAPQPDVLRVSVLDDVSRQPLPNAEVIDLSGGQHRFTNDRGEAQVAWPADGELRLRVRELGYRFEERTIRRDARTGDTATFALRRIAYVLPSVVSTAPGGCISDADPVAKELSIAVLEQLRQGAERYQRFEAAYPFDVRLERRTAIIGPDGKGRLIGSSIEEGDSKKWGDEYAPGLVVDHSRAAFSIPILFITSLANPVFWENHCFMARGVESQGKRRVVRLEFSPVVTLRSADWQGVAFVDSATSLLRRIEFQLVLLESGDQPRRFEGYSTFAEPSPFIVVPDSTVAVWWRHDAAADGRWGPPDRLQSLHLESLKYRKAKPPRKSP